MRRKNLINEITLKNWKCHSNLPLTFKEGVNFIIGFNGIGKTAVLEAIVFSLIGRVRTKDKKEFININSTEGTKVNLIFKQNDNQYQITREFNGVLKSKLEGKDVELTNEDSILEFIEKIYNSDKVFLENILYSSEGETYKFLKLNQNQLLNYLEQLIGIGKINDFKNMIKNLNKVFNNRRDDNKKLIETLKKFELKEDIEDKFELKKKKEILKQKLDSIRIERNRIEHDLSNFRKNKDVELNKNYDYNKASSKINELYEQNTEVFSEIGFKQLDLQQLINNIRQIHYKNKGFVEEIKIIKNKIQQLKEQKIENNIKLTEKKEIKEIINKLELNYQADLEVYCPLCKKSLLKDEFIKIHKNNIKEISSLEEEIHRFQETIQKKEIKLRLLNNKVKYLEEVLETLELLSNFNDNKLEKIKNSMEEINRKIDIEVQRLKLLRKEQDEKERELFNVELSLREHKAAEKVKDALGYEKTYKESIKGSLICDMTIEALDDILGKQRNINLNDLITDIQEIWEVFFPYEERILSIDNKYYPYFKKSGNEIPFTNVSAGEKMILMILIKTLLLKKYTKIPFLILDEPLEHLSLENRINIINYLIDIHKKGLINQLIITTFEESLTRQYVNSEDVNIISLPSIKKYKL